MNTNTLRSDTDGKKKKKQVTQMIELSKNIETSIINILYMVKKSRRSNEHEKRNGRYFKRPNLSF